MPLYRDALGRADSNPTRRIGQVAHDDGFLGTVNSFRPEFVVMLAEMAESMCLFRQGWIVRFASQHRVARSEQVLLPVRQAKISLCACLLH